MLCPNVSSASSVIRSGNFRQLARSTAHAHSGQAAVVATSSGTKQQPCDTRTHNTANMSLEVASSAQDSREEEHFELFSQLGFMQVVEAEEGPVVVLIGKNFSWSHTKKLLPSLYRFVAGALEELGSRPYTILYVHTECSYWQNSPGVRWLCSTYRRLPQACRDDLQRCYVLHADWVLSLAAATVCPWLQGDFWDKVSYVQLLEFLPPALRGIPLPEFVLEHDTLLTKQPLMDYGIVADPQETLLVPQLEPMLRGAEPEELEEE